MILPAKSMQRHNFRAEAALHKLFVLEVWICLLHVLYEHAELGTPVTHVIQTSVASLSSHLFVHKHSKFP